MARIEQAEIADDLDFLFTEVPDAISQSLDGLDRIAKIVRAMKEFSHPSSKEKAHANLNRAIESTVTVAQQRVEIRGGRDVRLRPAPAVGEVLPSATSTRSCSNLIVNAAHAVGDVVKERPGTKGRITISTRRDGDFAEVRVIDSGAGIPEALRARVFEPFLHHQSARQRKRARACRLSTAPSSTVTAAP